MQRLYGQVRALARKTISVLVSGETGVGKEVLVEELHRCSGRPGALRVLNCAAIPRELTESVLFGHERGAFTGATVRNRGLFEEAHRGTLLLDEVGDLAPDAQVALLRVLQHKRVMRVGSTVETEVDVRVVAATHRDLAAMVVVGQFREDLLYRLNAFTLHVPPLRERREEILPLANHFLRRVSAEWGDEERRLSPEAEQTLREHDWPGNIRQLRNAIEHAAVLCRLGVVVPADLPVEVRAPSYIASAITDRPPPTSIGPLRERVRRFEIDLVANALAAARGNISQAARLLHVPPRTLHSKLHSWGLLDQLTKDSYLPRPNTTVSNLVEKLPARSQS
jgi:DNA-binding NtrC family response regulator